MVSMIATKKRPDPERGACVDCTHCQAPGRISWWCSSLKAIKYRGTSIPGVKNCRFWEPIQFYPDLSFWQKLKALMSENIFVD